MSRRARESWSLRMNIATYYMACDITAIGYAAGYGAKTASAAQGWPRGRDVGEILERPQQDVELEYGIGDENGVGGHAAMLAASATAFS